MPNPPPVRIMGRPMGGSGPRGPVMREKPKNTTGTVKRLVRYIGRSRYLLIGLLAVMLFVTLLSLAGPALQALAIDCITLTDRQLSVDFSGLFRTLAVMAGVYVLSSVLTYFQGIFAARLSQYTVCLLYTSPSPRDYAASRMPSSA